MRKQKTNFELILTNIPKGIQNSGTYEKGLLQFYQMAVLTLGFNFLKYEPGVILYHDYKSFVTEYSR